MKESGRKKAAKLLLALGEENASQIFQYLDERLIEKLIIEIAEIDQINPEEKETLLKEFKEKINSSLNQDRGGKEKAKELLINALGKEKSERYIEKINQSDIHLKFREIEEYPPEDLASVLKKELPQTSAIVLTQLKAPYSAAVIRHFESKYAAQVSYRIAKASDVLPEVLNAVYQSLLEKMKKFSGEKFYEINGENRLAQILKYINHDDEENILTTIRNDDSDMAERIVARLFEFTDIVELNQKEIRTIFERLSSYEVWAKALKGAGEELRRHILSSVSINRSADIIDEMDRLENLPVNEIENNRKTIIQTIRQLEEEGSIILNKEKGKYIS